MKSRFLMVKKKKLSGHRRVWTNDIIEKVEMAYLTFPQYSGM